MLARLLRSLRRARTGTDRSYPVASAPVDQAQLQTLFARARAALNGGQFDSARSVVDDLLRLAPELPQSYYLHALVLMQTGSVGEAIAALRDSLRREPGFTEARLQLAIALYRQAQYASALSEIETVVLEAPADPRGYLWLAETARQLDQFDYAATTLERALALDPHNAEVHASLAVILLTRLEHPDAALVHSTEALRIDPALRIAQLDHALVLQEFGRFDEAQPFYDQLTGDDAVAMNARLNSALIRLGRGELGAAWDDYEVRRQLDGFHYGPPGVPDWNGEALESRTILAYWEQGLGDEIMFASCIPDLMRSARACIFECSPRLEVLFKRSFPGAIVRGVAPGSTVSELPRPDFRVALGSLPRHFRRHRIDFPHHDGYLRADPDRVAYWREHLSHAFGNRLKVGISWRGGLAHSRRTARSLSLERLLPLLDIDGVGFVSLQYGECRSEIDAILERRRPLLVHYDGAIADYAETAALVASLDLVITVCTAVAHLAGALGRQAWVLVPSTPEWRYMHAGEQIPWYPALRLFRSQRRGEWNPVVQDVIERLRARVRDSGAQRSSTSS